MKEITSPQLTPVPSEAVRSEAAAWVARLHDEQRSADVDVRFHAWLAQSEHHRRAFERMTQVWERAGQIRMRPRTHTAGAGTVRPWRLSPTAVKIAASLAIAAIFAVRYWQANEVVTGVGQQQVRVLQDGTRIALNTDTRIEVNYDEGARRVRLIRGEAWFDVAKRPTWPFLVSVGGQEIRALGTSFIVRNDDIQDLSVTLVEGRISIAPLEPNGQSSSQSPQILVPGQRLMLSRNHAPTVDRPEMARITAWKRGQVEFDRTPLADAVKEMNRYSTTRVSVADAEAAQFQVGGIFRAGDSDEFVRIVTAAFGLRAVRNGNEVVLSRLDPPPER
ncbi:MAG: FecR domain-containing protein [Pseudomonadota bacterium]|nr:FecR domain-containing protein [Pseudomonadota bacterium]